MARLSPSDNETSVEDAEAAAILPGSKCPDTVIGKQAHETRAEWRISDSKTRAHADTQTNAEAIFNLLNNCLGTGMLTIALAFKRVGLLGGFIGLVAFALLNRYTLLLTVRCCRAAECEVAVARLAEVALGWNGRRVVVISYLSLCLGVLIAYTNAAKNGSAHLLALVDCQLEPWQLAALVFLALTPLTFIRSLRKVAVLSSVAFVGAVAVICGVTGRSGIDMARGETAAHVALLDVSPIHICAAIPLLSLSMSAQSGGAVIFASLRDQSSKNLELVAWKMYAIVFSLNICLGAGAYLRFGDAIQGNVLDSLGDADPCGVLARVGMLVLASLSYIFIMVPARVYLMELCFRKSKSIEESSSAKVAIVSLAIGVICQGVAFVIEDISLIVGVVGAVSSNLIAFVLPPLIHLALERSSKGFSWSLSSAAHVSLCIFGCVSLVLSLASVLKTAM